MKKDTLKKFKLPDKPGVYFFLSRSVSPRSNLKNSKGSTFSRPKNKILYIGKATSLKNRVRSYFAPDVIKTRGPLIVDMVFKSNAIKHQQTDSVLEALILEAELIKKHQPYYNTKEKDDKSFNYVVITKEKIPKVLIERGKSLRENPFSKNKIGLGQESGEGAFLKRLVEPARATRGLFKKHPLPIVDVSFGPFTSTPQLKEAMKIVRKIFPFMDGQSAKRDNYEFYKQVGLSPDVSNAEAVKQYQKNIRNLKLFFHGKKKQILKSLEKDMKSFAKERRFEEAGRIRNQIFALQHINDVALLKQEIETPKNYKKSFPRGFYNSSSFRIEAYDIAHMSGKNMVGVMTVVADGKADKSGYRKFIIRTQTGSNDTGALEEVLSRRFRHAEWGMPDVVVVDGGLAQIHVAHQVLKRYQLPIPVVSVVKDEHHKAREILGDKKTALGKEQAILFANSEAHRFAIRFHKDKRAENFLK